MPAYRPSRRPTRFSAEIVRQNVPNAGVNLFLVRLADAQHSEMSPKAVHHLEFAVWHELLLRLAVRRRKDHVIRESDDMRFRFNAAERARQIAGGVPAHVAVPPFPSHPDQIVWIQGAK